MPVAELRPENIIPYITTEYPFILSPSSQQTFTLNGLNFKPSMELTIPGFDGTIDNVTITSPTELEFTITAGVAVAVYDIVITNRINNTEWTGNGVDLIDVRALDWLDLRVGGNNFTDGNGAGNDIRYRSGMAMSRDADGMWFTGAAPWSSWVKFESALWTRGENKTIEWVFPAATSGAYMIGIGSDATDEGATNQYCQAEMVAYFPTATDFSRLYGNNGTVGSTAYYGFAANFGDPAIKIKFTYDGTVGPTVFTIYGLPSAAPVHWDDESTVIKTFSPGSPLAPDELNLMPFIIPRDGGVGRFAALRVA